MIKRDDQPPQADPLIDEVRAVRQKLADQFDNDIDKLCDECERVGSSLRAQRTPTEGTRAER